MSEGQSSSDDAILQHYPVCATSSGFLNVTDSETIELAKATQGLDYPGIRSEFRRMHKPWLMRYCRKLSANYLEKHVGQELTDLPSKAWIGPG